MKHYMKLNTKPFQMIKLGKKSVELRLNDEKRQKISVNDEIEFTNTENKDLKILTKVIAIHKFLSFEELYKNMPLLKCGYTEKNISDANAKDMEFYYSKEQQNKYGVLGFEIEII